jgi:hypothetical protein
MSPSATCRVDRDALLVIDPRQRAFQVGDDGATSQRAPITPAEATVRARAR